MRPATETTKWAHPYATEKVRYNVMVQSHVFMKFNLHCTLSLCVK